MGLYKKIDIWSIYDKLSEIMEGRYRRCFDNSEYAPYYDELFCEMANIAGDLWNELDRIKGQIFYKDIPMRSRKNAEEDDETENAAFWFNCVVLSLEDADAGALFYREDIFTDIEREKQKRLNALERLPKKDFIWLFTTVAGFVIRFLELEASYDTIKGTIDELDSRQAFVKDNGALVPPKVSFV